MFSKGLSRYDLVNIIVPRAISSAANGILTGSLKVFINNLVMDTTIDIFNHLFRNRIEEMRNKKLAGLTNSYLMEALEKYNYKKNRDYTINEKKSPITINLNNGILMINMKKGWSEDIVKHFNRFNSQITDMGKFTFISYQAGSLTELDKNLSMLMKYAKKVNIYDNR